MARSRTPLFAAVVTMALLAPQAAQSDTIPPRLALGLLLPTALRVVEQIEEERGSKITDAELARMLGTQEFKQRVESEARAEQLYLSCSRVKCFKV